MVAQVDANAIRTRLGGALSERGEDPATVIDALAEGADPGIVASAGPRHYGFVIGGALPAALAADWLVSAWDQCAAFHSLSPAAAAIEEIAAVGARPDGPAGERQRGVRDGRPGANTTCLAAARHAVLARAGWDVERGGLAGGPRVNVVVAAGARHDLPALRLLRLGSEVALTVGADDQGRMLSAELEKGLATLDGPTIVCAQAGNVATGSFDPFGPIADACRAQRLAARGRRLRAVGGASPSTRRLLEGVERADSWAVDAHKWLNVPYDSAMAIVADPRVHHAAVSLAASYLVADEGQRDNTNYVPEVLAPGARRAGLRRPALARAPGRGGAGGPTARRRAKWPRGSPRSPAPRSSTTS